MGDRRPNVGFAGDRDVAVRVLEHLIARGDRPAALLLPDEGQASHEAELRDVCARAGITPLVMRARELADAAAIPRLKALDLAFLVCVHFPYIVRRPVLEAASAGVLNLHPAYLPFNRGWHTPTWAILDGTPAGATLHYMNEGLDAGDIVYQEQLPVDPSDTAHTLYLKLKALELEVFRKGWDRITSGEARGVPQAGAPTAHRRQDLFDPAVQRLDLDAQVRAGDLLRRLRALTTSRVEEAMYFESGGRTYRVQVAITPDAPARERV